MISTRSSSSTCATNEEATQEATQEVTQEVAEHDLIDLTHLWGYLHHESDVQSQMNFDRSQHTYSIGRHTANNDFSLPGKVISNRHCEIHWDGRDVMDSIVTVTDMSTNGTFINGIKIGRCRKVIQDGDTISFGGLRREDPENYYFVYRHLADGLSLQGIESQYKFHGEIGRGSFATVLKASHRVDGGWYAVKRIRIDSARGSSAVRDEMSPENSYAFREVKVWEQLKHENICRLKDVFYEEDRIDLVLELVEGGDLLRYIMCRRGLREPEARHIAVQVLNAIAYMHSLGISHRDLKPANILLTTDEPPIVKVADFGLAKVVDDMTMLHTMCGTPSYLAPEVIQQGNQGYDLIVDSFSVGAIIFSMLTSSDPFIYDTRAIGPLAKVKSRRVNWAILQEVGVSSSAEDLIRQLLEVDPKKRTTPADALHHPWLAVPRNFQTSLPSDTVKGDLASTCNPVPEPSFTTRKSTSFAASDVREGLWASQGRATLSKDKTVRGG